MDEKKSRQVRGSTITVSPKNKNTLATWEAYFRDGWEKNNGRRQTRLFAQYFLDTVSLPPDAKTLLDVGCGLGDALPEFKARYPHLALSGCDVSEVAIEKARETFEEIATFQVWGFDQIESRYDVIFCSNVLEHFEDYLAIARHLLRHCRWLFVMVPYRELRSGKPLEVAEGEWHVATFDEHTFDALREEGMVRKIDFWRHPCPVAWGPARPQPEWKQSIRRVRDLFLGRPSFREPSEIIFRFEARA